MSLSRLYAPANTGVPSSWAPIDTGVPSAAFLLRNKGTPVLIGAYIRDRIFEMEPERLRSVSKVVHTARTARPGARTPARPHARTLHHSSTPAGRRPVACQVTAAAWCRSLRVVQRGCMAPQGGGWGCTKFPPTPLRHLLEGAAQVRASWGRLGQPAQPRQPRDERREPLPPPSPPNLAARPDERGERREG
jgi:hypothetical protein